MSRCSPVANALASSARTPLAFGLGIILAACSEETGGNAPLDPQVEVHALQLELPGPLGGAGGLAAADLDGDDLPELVVTAPGFVAGIDAEGLLWAKEIDIHLTSKAEDEGLPGLHAPGVQAADLDGDGRSELLLLGAAEELIVLDGATGEPEQPIALPAPPDGAARWEHLVVADFRGTGDRDLLLQATNDTGYRFGRFLAAFPLEALRADGAAAAPLWTRRDFLPAAHSGARVADLDGDGRDEVLGAAVVGADGDLVHVLPVRGHIDAVAVADIRPDLPGLEVVALEEQGHNRIFLYNREGLVWEANHRRQEPQNTAVGAFDPGRAGLEIWCRSRYGTHQKPFVFDAQGQLIAAYEMDQVAPEGWTEKGVEVIATIDWTGEARQLAVAKERHATGDVAIFDPISGRFLHRFDTEAARLYVADLLGDWREEIVVLTTEGALQIYENRAPNPDAERPRLWTRKDYRRSKATWNYYNT